MNFSKTINEYKIKKIIINFKSKEEFLIKENNNQVISAINTFFSNLEESNQELKYIIDDVINTNCSNIFIYNGEESIENIIKFLNDKKLNYKPNEIFEKKKYFFNKNKKNWAYKILSDFYLLINELQKVENLKLEVDWNLDEIEYNEEKIKIDKIDKVIKFLEKNKGSWFEASQISKKLLSEDNELCNILSNQKNKNKEPYAQFSAEISSWFHLKTERKEYVLKYMKRRKISEKNKRYEISYNENNTILNETEENDKKLNKKNFIKEEIKMIDINKLKPNLIVFGPPGTGKSYKINESIKNNVNNYKVFRTTFHPEYSYSDFVGQYKPVVGFKTDVATYIDHNKKKIEFKLENENDKKYYVPHISYSFVGGTFLDSYIEAYNNPETTVYLIIEEINRGNCAAIFGDIFQLLDRDNDFISQYPIKTSFELLQYIEKEIKEDIDKKLRIPSNLIIIGTMNTSDQSLFPIDSAFKRRWNMRYVEINYEEISDVFIESNENEKINYSYLLEDINLLILKHLKSEDKQIGQWFIKSKNNLISFEDFKHKIIHYLYFDVFKHGRDKIFTDISYHSLIQKESLKDIFKESKEDFKKSKLFED